MGRPRGIVGARTAAALTRVGIPVLPYAGPKRRTRRPRPHAEPDRKMWTRSLDGRYLWRMAWVWKAIKCPKCRLPRWFSERPVVQVCGTNPVTGTRWIRSYPVKQLYGAGVEWHRTERPAKQCQCPVRP